ncbi:UDP-N-acetylglucosamine 1-carboxyvinyltransferase, partial [Salmonella enterica subsp. enterica serovar Typhimurium]
ISGAKNAALPILAAAILTEDTLRVTNVPKLRDVATTAALLTQMGMWVRQPAPGVFELSGHALSNSVAPYDLVKTMRASILVLGPLVARCGE